LCAGEYFQDGFKQIVSLAGHAQDVVLQRRLKVRRQQSAYATTLHKVWRISPIMYEVALPNYPEILTYSVVSMQLCKVYAPLP
jgi:hypothetical protein